MVRGSISSSLETLKGGFQILHHSPAQRDDFESITGSTKYPLYFCATRWVENKLVTDSMIEVWPHLIKIVNFWDSLQKSKQPSCKSYENIHGVRDPLMIAKLNFFSFICGHVEPYLKKFQTDQPMVPFIYMELKSMMKSLISLVKDIDLTKEENLLPNKDMELGFGVREELKKLIREDTVTKKDVRKFWEEAKSVIVQKVYILY